MAMTIKKASSPADCEIISAGNVALFNPHSSLGSPVADAWRWLSFLNGKSVQLAYPAILPNIV